MPHGFRIQHINVNVDDLEIATAFYRDVLGLEPIATPEQGFVSQFFALSGDQEIHMNQLPDRKPYRAHICFVADDFMGVFRRAKAAGVIDTEVWGKIRRLPSGSMQMFLRDPSGNLLEISSPRDAQLPESLFQDELVDPEPGLFTIAPGTILPTDPGAARATAAQPPRPAPACSLPPRG